MQGPERRKTARGPVDARERPADGTDDSRSLRDEEDDELVALNRVRTRSVLSTPGPLGHRIAVTARTLGRVCSRALPSPLKRRSDRDHAWSRVGPRSRRRERSTRCDQAMTRRPAVEPSARQHGAAGFAPAAATSGNCLDEGHKSSMWTVRLRVTRGRDRTGLWINSPPSDASDDGAVAVSHGAQLTGGEQAGCRVAAEHPAARRESSPVHVRRQAPDLEHLESPSAFERFIRLVESASSRSRSRLAAKVLRGDLAARRRRLVPRHGNRANLALAQLARSHRAVAGRRRQSSGSRRRRRDRLADVTTRRAHGRAVTEPSPRLGRPCAQRRARLSEPCARHDQPALVRERAELSRSVSPPLGDDSRPAAFRPGH